MSYRRYVFADYERLLALRAEGKTFPQIGEIMGMSDGSAYWLSKQGHRLPVKLSAKAQAGKPRKKDKPQRQGKYFKHDPFYNF